MIAITAEQIESCLDYERFQHAKWTPIPVKGNYPRLAIGTVGLAGREAGSWIATHATDAFNPPWASDVVAYPKFSFPRQASEAAAIEAEIEVVVERCEREMRRPGSKVDLRTLQRAIAAVKTFGGKLSFEKYAAETAAQKNRSIPKMSTFMNTKYPVKKARPKAKARNSEKHIWQEEPPGVVTSERSEDETRLNDCGVYEEQLISVPAKRAGAKITIEVADCGPPQKTRWRANIYEAIVEKNGISLIIEPITKKTPGFPTRQEAISWAAVKGISELQSQLETAKGDKFRAAVRDAIEDLVSFSAEWQETPSEESAAKPPSGGIVVASAPFGGLLPPAERKKLDKCEATIEKNLASFFDVGIALATIQKDRLYREKHASFELYCQQKWDFGRQHAYRLIDAAAVIQDLSPNGDSDKQFLPQTESQARALAKIKEPKKRKEVWEDIVASHPKFTAKVIEETVAQVLGKPKAKAEGGRGKAEEKKTAAKRAARDTLDADLDEIRETVQAVADLWQTKYQRQQICDLLRRLAKELTVK